MKKTCDGIGKNETTEGEKEVSPLEKLLSALVAESTQEDSLFAGSAFSTKIGERLKERVEKLFGPKGGTGMAREQVERMAEQILIKGDIEWVSKEDLSIIFSIAGLISPKNSSPVQRVSSTKYQVFQATQAVH